MTGLLGGQVAQAQQEISQAAAPSAVVQPAAATYKTGDFPGLQPLKANSATEFHQFTSVESSGLSYIKPSKQYVQVPSAVLAADVGIKPGPTGNTFTAAATFISPVGAADAFGDLPMLGTRLLAFGAFPVEAVVHLDQIRDDDDLPVPLQLSSTDLTGTDASGNFTFTHQPGLLTGNIEIRVSDVSIAGVPVDVGSSCMTSAPSPLSLVGRGYIDVGSRRGTFSYPIGVPQIPQNRLTAQQITDDFYTLATGGLLTGTLDIASFTGCTGSAGDVSRLVSTAVSGSGQPLAIRQTALTSCFPTYDAAACQKPDNFPYPTTENFPYPPGN